VRASADDPLEQVLTKATSDALRWRELVVVVSERAPAPTTDIAAFAPHQMHHTTGDRQVPQPDPRPLLDPDLVAIATRTGGCRNHLIDPSHH
jgi:hypothetical protein